MLNYVGIDLSSIALVGGAVAFGLGFGLQNVFSNFISGIIILLEGGLRVGDFVDLESGVRGHVREIAMRYTRVTTNDAIDVLVPNSEFINGRVINWTFDATYRRMRIPFGVAYGTPKEQVQRGRGRRGAQGRRRARRARPRADRLAGRVRRQLGQLRSRVLGRPPADDAPGARPTPRSCGRWTTS